MKYDASKYHHLYKKWVARGVDYNWDKFLSESNITLKEALDLCHGNSSVHPRVYGEHSSEKSLILLGFFNPVFRTNFLYPFQASLSRGSWPYVHEGDFDIIF